MPPVRTRFAPSPTGSLHLGNLRVALFNDLFTRRHGGTLVLRVEDTDLDRNVEGALEGILADLAWAGIEWGEGPDVGGPFAPYRQSERGERHAAAAHRLLEEGKAYLCFCDEALLAETRGENPHAPGCPGGCRTGDRAVAAARVAAGEGAAIRFAVPDATVTFQDEIRGKISWEGRDLGDFVLLRSDGRATYNFAVVVDDVEMEITHVIRGSGHLSNTPKHALLFDALGVPRPVFAHLPQVLGADRRKLSKREGAAGVERYRREGYPPDGVVNYLSLLGWSTEDEVEILSRDELAARMELGRAGASDTILDPEKLRWVCGQHLARHPLDTLVSEVTPFLDRARFPAVVGREREVVAALRTRLHTLAEINEHLTLLHPSEAALAAAWEELRGEERGVEILEATRSALVQVPLFEPEGISAALRECAKALGVRGPTYFHPVRLAVMGARSGPDLGLSLAALGREEVVGRIDGALAGVKPA